MRLGEIPHRNSMRQVGVINRPMGFRNEPRIIAYIVGFSSVSDLIYASIRPSLQAYFFGSPKVAGTFATALTATDSLPDADVALFEVSAISGINAEGVELWQTARELYIPSIVLITDLIESENDFEDMVLIAGRILDPLVTPYLILHSDSGEPAALIDLDTLLITDYSRPKPELKPSEAEHKNLVLEFRQEFFEAREAAGNEAFENGLLFPAIPLIPEIKMGIAEVLSYLTKL
jgi:hypothetical protein